MQHRPRLKSHARPLRRGPGSLQLGLSPDAGIVLDGLSEAEIAITEGLDGSRDLRALHARAAEAGVSADRVSALIAALVDHRLLIDTATDRAWLSPHDGTRCRPDDTLRQPARPDLTAMAISAAYHLASDGLDYLSARSTQHVLISGDGDLPCALAELLRAGGIGRVSVGISAANSLDLELRSHRADRLAPAGPAQQPGSGPDLVVLAALGAIHAEAGEPWLRRGIPHLPVVVQAHHVQVGPLITRIGGPCLSCMDLHRRDRDPAWPALLSQLSPTWPLRPGPPITLESTLAATTVGLAAMIVHTCLDGQPVPRDLSLEVSLPWPAILSRRWIRHPLCGCMANQGTMAG